MVVGDPISPIEQATSGVTISPNEGAESGKNKVFDRGENGGNKTDSTWPPVSRRDTSPVSQTQVNSDIEKHILSKKLVRWKLPSNIKAMIRLCGGDYNYRRGKQDG